MICHDLWLRRCWTRTWHLTLHPSLPLQASSSLSPPSSHLRSLQGLCIISPSLFHDSWASHPGAVKPELPPGLGGCTHQISLELPISICLLYLDHHDLALEDFSTSFLSECPEEVELMNVQSQWGNPTFLNGIKKPDHDNRERVSWMPESVCDLWGKYDPVTIGTRQTSCRQKCSLLLRLY